MDELAKKRAEKEKLESLFPADRQKIFKAAVETFGDRLAKAVNEGIEAETAFAECKKHFSLLAELMQQVVDVSTMEVVRKKDDQKSGVWELSTEIEPEIN